MLDLGKISRTLQLNEEQLQQAKQVIAIMGDQKEECDNCKVIEETVQAQACWLCQSCHGKLRLNSNPRLDPYFKHENFYNWTLTETIKRIKTRPPRSKVNKAVYVKVQADAESYNKRGFKNALKLIRKSEGHLHRLRRNWFSLLEDKEAFDANGRPRNFFFPEEYRQAKLRIDPPFHRELDFLDIYYDIRGIYFETYVPWSDNQVTNAIDLLTLQKMFLLRMFFFSSMCRISLPFCIDKDFFENLHDKTNVPKRNYMHKFAKIKKMLEDKATPEEAILQLIGANMQEPIPE